MYNAHFQFRECPFGVTPDPQFYYSNAVYREAWATLRYGVEGRKGFIVISGQTGTGKTTLLRKALHQFPANIKAAYIPNTLVSFNELLRLILKDLGLPSSTKDKFNMMDLLNQYLLEQSHSGHIVTLLIDEAQDLSLECLEELRLLGNLETDKHKLLQIVLVGQPGLERKLNQPELLQLKQRVVVRCRLQPVETDEVGAYIESRLQTIGHTSANLFDPEAIEKIAFYSKGIPRLINIICDNALLNAYAASKFKVSAAMIEEAADDLVIGNELIEPEARPEAPIRQVEEPVRAVAKNVSLEPQPVQMNAAATPAAPHRNPSSLPRNSRYSKPMIGTLAAIVLLTVLGGYLYSYKGMSSAINAAGNIAAPVAGGHTEAGQAELAAHAPQTKSSALNPPASQTHPLEPIAVANQNVAAALPEESTKAPAVEEKVNAPQLSSSSITPEHKESAPPPRDNRRENASAVNFFVTGASFVRAHPTSNAEIIATLQPGTRINVAGRTGEYYRVRSLETDTIRGYVHKEDAFFERH
jgi:type II secretory pathway predicted ATPase ExeA